MSIVVKPQNFVPTKLNDFTVFQIRYGDNDYYLTVTFYQLIMNSVTNSNRLNSDKSPNTVLK